MEYAVVNDDANGFVFLVLVEKGFFQEHAFKCLAAMRQDFARFFDVNYALNAKAHSLSKDFEGAFERIYVEELEPGRVLGEHGGQGLGGQGPHERHEERAHPDAGEAHHARREAH